MSHRKRATLASIPALVHAALSRHNRALGPKYVSFASNIEVAWRRIDDALKRMHEKETSRRLITPSPR